MPAVACWAGEVRCGGAPAVGASVGCGCVAPVWCGRGGVWTPLLLYVTWHTAIVTRRCVNAAIAVCHLTYSNSGVGSSRVVTWYVCPLSTSDWAPSTVCVSTQNQLERNSTRVRQNLVIVKEVTLYLLLNSVCLTGN
jgi:hypothetical protein